MIYDEIYKMIEKTKKSGLQDGPGSTNGPGFDAKHLPFGEEKRSVVNETVLATKEFLDSELKRCEWKTSQPWLRGLFQSYSVERIGAAVTDFMRNHRRRRKGK